MSFDVWFDDRGQQLLGPIQLVGIVYMSQLRQLTFFPYIMSQLMSMCSAILAQTITIFK